MFFGLTRPAANPCRRWGIWGHRRIPETTLPACRRQHGSRARLGQAPGFDCRRTQCPAHILRPCTLNPPPPSSGPQPRICPSPACLDQNPLSGQLTYSQEACLRDPGLQDRALPSRRPMRLPGRSPWRAMARRSCRRRLLLPLQPAPFPRPRTLAAPRGLFPRLSMLRTPRGLLFSGLSPRWRRRAAPAWRIHIPAVWAPRRRHRQRQRSPVLRRRHRGAIPRHASLGTPALQPWRLSPRLAMAPSISCRMQPLARLSRCPPLPGLWTWMRTPVAFQPPARRLALKCRLGPGRRSGPA